jgi:hypothetical protein
MMKTNFELHLTLELLYFCLDYGGNWEVSSADAMNLTCWHLEDWFALKICC